MARVPSQVPPGQRSRGSELLVQWRGHLSQEAAAVALGIDHGAICAYETGHKRPGPKRAARIAARSSGLVPVESWGTPPRNVKAS